MGRRTKKAISGLRNLHSKKKQRLETPVDVSYDFDDGDYDCSPQLSMPTKNIISSVDDATIFCRNSIVSLIISKIYGAT